MLTMTSAIVLRGVAGTDLLPGASKPVCVQTAAAFRPCASVAGL